MFVFGAQYLRGATPLPEDWDRDMRSMRDLGFNTIRAWLVWNTVEPSPNKIDTQYLDRFFDCAVNNDLQVGVLFHMHGAPEWAIHAYPECFYVDEDGRPFQPAVRPNTPSGGWPGLCYDNPIARELMLSFIERVTEHLHSCPAISFWEPMNEPHVWVDMTKDPAGNFCYCGRTVELFREWLKKKYESLDALNKAWGRPHTCWEEVRPPTWKFGVTDWIDWRRFHADNLVVELERRSKAIRGRDSRPVIAHAWGTAPFCWNLAGMAFDDWKNAALFDKWGLSAFPSKHSDTVMVGAGAVVTRNAARGKEFWQAELCAGDTGNFLFPGGRVAPETLAAWTWQSIAQGAKGVLYWQYRKERHGIEMGGLGLADYAGRPTANSLMASRMAMALNQNDQLFSNAKPWPAEVALVFSPSSYHANWVQKRNNQVAMDCLSGYFRIFWEANIPTDIIHEEFINLRELMQYKLVVVPFPLMLHPTLPPKLKAYVEDGGTLLSDPMFCSLDGNGWLQAETPGYGWHEVFGARQDDVERQKEVELTFRARTGRVTGTHYVERYVATGGEPIAAYSGGADAIVSHRVGKGTAIISGLNLGLACSPQTGVGDDAARTGTETANKFAREIVLTLASEAGVVPPVRVSVAGISTSFLVDDKNGEALLIVGEHNRREVVATLGLPEGLSSAFDLIEKRAMQFTPPSLSVPLLPWQTRVIRLR